MPTSENQNGHRKTVGQWLLKPYEWRIPVYQRHYAWSPLEEFGPTQLFWEIVEEQADKRLSKKKVDPHYFGAILVKNKTVDLESTQKYDVVDGQQRLTTINVAIFSIIGIASQLGYREEVQGSLAKYIFNDPSQDSQKQPKLVPTNFDRTQFGNLRSGAFDVSQVYKDDSEQAKKSKVVEACHFFSESFKTFVDKNPTNEMAAINALIDTIVDGFELVLIALNKTDEAQKVFESLNNTARPLTTFDLIRNDIFYRADKALPGSDERLFNSPEWQQFENVFWEETPGRSDKTTHVEAYISRMLMTKRKQVLLLNRNAIFKEYKSFAKDESKKGLGVSDEIKTISEYVNIYKYLVGTSTQNPLMPDFKFGYFMFKICKSMDFYPAIFTISNCDTSAAEKQRMIYLLESYVIRRTICKLPSADYNKQAPRICEALGNEPNYEKLHAFLNGSHASETREFPSDQRVLSACLNSNFYTKNKLKKYIFDSIVDHTTDEKYDEKRDTRGLTIDHIMPQKWRDKDEWIKMRNGFEDEDIEIKIHTIGNLTPMSMGLNSAKSNHGWDGPKGAKAHLAKCDLKMTRMLADKDKWDIDDINERNKDLAGMLCKIWLSDIK